MLVASKSGLFGFEPGESDLESLQEKDRLTPDYMPATMSWVAKDCFRRNQGSKAIERTRMQGRRTHCYLEWGATYYT